MTVLVLILLQFLFHFITMRRSLRYLLFTFCACSTFAASQKTYETLISRRERNLDHWDAETLAAYLGLDVDTAKPLPDSEHQYAGIDAAVMFYAQWCKNCQRFAQIWDTIGTLVHAGTTQSNLIMALFNCELNDQHTRLCNAAGVTHYPTLMFVGAGPYADSDPVSTFLLKDKAAGPYGATTLKRTVKFQGDLNIGDSVLDWIRAMQGLSKWYKWGHTDGGWLKTIRSLFFNPFDKKKGKQDVQKTALPVGIPPVFGKTSGESTKSAYVLQKELKESEGKVSSMKIELQEYELATSHAGHLIQSFLFPKMADVADEGTSKKALDVFAVLDEVKGWNSKLSSPGNSTTETKLSIENDEGVIMKACVMGLTLDFCTRLSKKLTTDYLDSLDHLEQSKYPSFTEMEAQLRVILNETEPFCGIFDDCYAKDFKGEECRPSTCPFKNDGACRYVGSCLTEPIMSEYKDALETQLNSKVGEKTGAVPDEK